MARYVNRPSLKLNLSKPSIQTKPSFKLNLSKPSLPKPYIPPKTYTTPTVIPKPNKITPKYYTTKPSNDYYDDHFAVPSTTVIHHNHSYIPPVVVIPSMNGYDTGNSTVIYDSNPRRYDSASNVLGFIVGIVILGIFLLMVIKVMSRR